MCTAHLASTKLSEGGIITQPHLEGLEVPGLGRTGPGAAVPGTTARHCGRPGCKKCGEQPGRAAAPGAIACPVMRRSSQLQTTGIQVKQAILGPAASTSQVLVAKIKAGTIYAFLMQMRCSPKALSKLPMHWGCPCSFSFVSTCAES